MLMRRGAWVAARKQPASSAVTRTSPTAARQFRNDQAQMREGKKGTR